MWIDWRQLVGPCHLCKKPPLGLIHLGPELVGRWINRYQEWQDHGARVRS